MHMLHSYFYVRQIWWNAFLYGIDNIVEIIQLNDLFRYFAVIDPCRELMPCLNGATCNNFVTSYTCTCAPGWEGMNCERGEYVSLLYNICDSTHRKGPVGSSEDQNWLLCYFLNGCSFSSILVQEYLKSDIVFLRYGNFIDDVILQIDEKLILRSSYC